ncbi:Uncharacterized protein HZ326_2838 [Fusarium oxysporum f. sp. albedinis]|nr:Uncharacterized protein HZ326_2838 [Fusarium oxysporum f. sp. albedinis]
MPSVQLPHTALLTTTTTLFLLEICPVGDVSSLFLLDSGTVSSQRTLPISPTCGCKTPPSPLDTILVPARLSTKG